MKRRRRIISVSVMLMAMVAALWSASLMRSSGSFDVATARGAAPAGEKVAAPGAGVSKEMAAAYQTGVLPLVQEYCYQCHGEGNHKGGISLDAFKSIDDVEKHRDVWMQVLKDIQSGDMPAADAKKKPTLAERKTLTDWIERELYDDPAHPNPGRVTLHRLNRAEYNNTIRDLLAVDFKPAAGFPADGSGYGFDNNGDVLSLGPLLMEKYLDAAATILDKAIYVDPVVPPLVKHFDAATVDGTIPPSDPNGTTPGRGPQARPMPNGRVFNWGGEVYVDYVFPKAGQYNLKFAGYGRARPSVQLKLDNVDLDKPIQITDDQPNTRVYSVDNVKVTAGKHRITVALLNGPTKQEFDAATAAAAIAATQAATQPVAAAATQVAPADNAAGQGNRRGGGAGGAGAAGAADAAGAAAGNGFAGNGGRAGGRQAGGAAGQNRQGGAAGAAGAGGVAGAGGAAGRAGRGAAGGRGGVPQTLTGKATLGVVFIEAEGPTEVTLDRMPESYRRVMVSQPSATVTKAQAAELIIRNFASKAYRRPVEESEVKQLMGLWAKQTDAASFDESIHTTLQAVLISSNFLYRYEQDPGPNDNGVRTLNEFELASRLSYFLWSSMPDDELFSLARDGKLRANLASQVKRMVADPKSAAFVENFGGQWLQLRKMNDVGPDMMKFPKFDEALRAAMIKETQLYFSYIMTADRSVLEFLDSDYTFMNERLAQHYGRTDVKGDAFQKVAMTGKESGGLITQASILTITSYGNRTSPVQRGKWVLENLLDAAPPPPPPDVPKLVETEQAELTGTLRQRMEQHRTNPNCISCHSQMDPIGFGLENFDAIGAWRDKDVNNVTIDAAGELPDGSKFAGPSGLKDILKARKDEFCRCLSDRMLTYALGRGLEVYDRTTVDNIAKGLQQKDYKFSALINQIVESDAFQKRGSKRGDQ